MTVRKSTPPRLALWWLIHICRSKHNEALAGDLVERFYEGAARGWFWRQVLIASFTVALSAVRHRWAFFCYSAAGTLAIFLLQTSGPNPISSWLHWNDLPWPFSQIAFELSTQLIVSLAVLVVLASGLAVEHSFRWAFLLRTWIINLAMITLGHFSIDAVPGLWKPVPGDPFHKMLIIPAPVQILLLAATFLIAAWVGCPNVRRTESC